MALRVRSCGWRSARQPTLLERSTLNWLDFDRRLKVECGHCHANATVAVARKLIARTWATIISGTPYELQDLDGEPITRRRARLLVAELAVPDRIRARTRGHATATGRGRLAS